MPVAGDDSGTSGESPGPPPTFGPEDSQFTPRPPDVGEVVSIVGPKLSESRPEASQHPGRPLNEVAAAQPSPRGRSGGRGVGRRDPDGGHEPG